MSTKRQLDIAKLTGVAKRFAAGFGGQVPDDEAAVAELRAISTDPDVLSEAAGFYVNPGPDVWYAPTALRLLVQAGADEQAAGRWARVQEERRRGGFRLGALGEKAAEI